VQYPGPQFRIREEGEKRYIFDPLRKSWLLLTEEEWVRQNFVNYLTAVLKYPASFIALEKEIALFGLKKRFDVLVYGRGHQPWLMVECKAPGVPLDESVLQQVLRYNISVPVHYLVITNGAATIGWKKEGGKLELLSELPLW
jgi:hypothetical protein